MNPNGIYRRSVEGLEIFRLSGKLNADNAVYTQKRLTDAINEGHKKLVIDLQDLENVDKVGMQALLQTQKKITESKGEMVLSSLNKKIMDVFAIAGLDRIFVLAGSEDEAINKMKKS